MYTKKKRPGKFEGCESQLVGEVLYQLSACGPDEQVGSVDDLGWYGLILGKKRAWIVREDHFGFFDYETFTHEEARGKWDEIEDEYQDYYS